MSPFNKNSSPFLSWNKIMSLRATEVIWYLCWWHDWWHFLWQRNLSNVSIEIDCLCENDIDVDPCKIIHKYIWWILKLSTHRFISLQNCFQISRPFYQWIICLDMKYISFCSSFGNFCDWKILIGRWRRSSWWCCPRWCGRNGSWRWW